MYMYTNDIYTYLFGNVMLLYVGCFGYGHYTEVIIIYRIFVGIL